MVVVGENGAIFGGDTWAGACDVLSVTRMYISTTYTEGRSISTLCGLVWRMYRANPGMDIFPHNQPTNTTIRKISPDPSAILSPYSTHPLAIPTVLSLPKLLLLTCPHYRLLCPIFHLSFVHLAPTKRFLQRHDMAGHGRACVLCNTHRGEMVCVG